MDVVAIEVDVVLVLELVLVLVLESVVEVEVEVEESVDVEDVVLVEDARVVLLLVELVTGRTPLRKLVEDEVADAVTGGASVWTVLVDTADGVAGAGGVAGEGVAFPEFFTLEVEVVGSDIPKALFMALAH